MAPQEPKAIAKAICSKLKIVSQPNFADIINSRTKFYEAIEILPHFFSSMPNELNAKWVEHEIHSPRFSHRYLLVIGSICSVLGTHCYTKEILEDGEIEPKQCLILMGYTSEMIIFKYLSRYLLEMMEGLHKSNRIIPGNGPKKRAEREKQFYMPIYRILHGITKCYRNYPSQLKKFKRGLHRVIINHKFEYYKNKSIPALGGKIKLKELRITNGKWMKHRLLWAK